MSNDDWKNNMHIGGPANPYRHTGSGHLVDAEKLTGGITFMGNFAGPHPHLHERSPIAVPAKTATVFSLSEDAKDKAHIFLKEKTPGVDKPAHEILAAALDKAVAVKGNEAIEAGYAKRFKSAIAGMQRIGQGRDKIEGDISDAASLMGLLKTMEKTLPSLGADAKAALQVMQQALITTGLQAEFAPYFNVPQR
jgi:hypothetical protein